MFIFLCFNRGFTYYKMSNLDNRIANADQLLTTDVDKFCDTVTDLYSNISKPVLDIVIYVYRLTTQIGGKVNDRYCESRYAVNKNKIIVMNMDHFLSNLFIQTPSVLLAYLIIAGWFLTYLRRPTGRMTVTEQKLEGEFRYINSRLIMNSEEVAFYQGNQREKLTLLASFQKLVCTVIYNSVPYMLSAIVLLSQMHVLLSDRLSGSISLESIGEIY